MLYILNYQTMRKMTLSKANVLWIPSLFLVNIKKNDDIY